MKNMNLYYHGGSKNHGCEAIIRSTAKILDTKPTLFSFDIGQDLKYKLNEVVELKSDTVDVIRKGSFSYFSVLFSRKILNSDYKYICESHKKFFSKASNNSIFLSVGGDNYCYGGREILGYYNRRLHRKGAKTVLWGCSFEPKDINIPHVKEDLALYDLIIARESMSYEVLKKVNKNTYLFPDPAFILDAEKLPLPDGFIENETIGINLSPLIGNYGNIELIYNNYKKLIEYIINNTNFNIALIPHVVSSHNDDRIVLTKLYNDFKRSDRVFCIEDCNCMQLKGYISRCRMFIGARTHSTIAAYSSCVPTLVTGYSVKARGIAKDLFGTEQNYVIPVQNLQSDYDLIKAFKWLSENEDGIRNHLVKIIPEYKSRVLKVKEILEIL